MRFNQIVWDALCFAAQRNIGHEDALHAYASDCDGNAKITYKARTGGIHTAEFIPNPDVKY